jgi:predicted MFS family arabinose efflux permease
MAVCPAWKQGDRTSNAPGETAKMVGKMTDDTARDAQAATPARAGGGLPSGWLGVLAIAVMVCGPAMTGMMLTIVLPILPNIARDIAGGRDVLIAMPTSGIVVGGIVAGILLSRIPARSLMLWMTVAYGVIGFAGMALQGWELLGSRFLIGIVSTCISAASTTLIGEHIAPDKRPRVLGLQMAGSSLVGIGAMNISASLNDSFGWRASFMLFPIIAAIVFTAGYFLIPVSSRLKTEGAVERSSRSRWRVLADMWPLYLLLLVMHATAYTPNSQAAFVLESDGLTSATGRSHMMSINQAMIVLAAFFYPVTRRMIGSRWIPAFFLTSMATGLILLGLSTNLLVAGIALGFLGLANGTFFPHQSNLVLTRAAPAIRGAAVGLMSSTQFFADSINPFLYRPLVERVGLHTAIVSVGLLVAAGVLAALVYGARASDAPLPEGAKSFGH